MSYTPFADTTPTVSLVVACVALAGSIGAALVAVFGAQRVRETEFQTTRRAAYVRMMTALRTGSLPSTEQPYDYSVLIEEIRQLSPDIRHYIDAHVPEPLKPLGQAALNQLQAAIDYQQTPWILRRGGRKRPAWLDT